eukprot:COSAG02_NODE_27407_length_610_cov_1.178082_1_plen_60_part_10
MPGLEPVTLGPSRPYSFNYKNFEKQPANAYAKLAKIPVYCTGSVRTNQYFVNLVESCVVV